MNILLRGGWGKLLSLVAIKMVSLAQVLGLKQRRLGVLTYHQIVNHAGPFLSGEMHVSGFTEQIDIISKHFNPLPLDRALQMLQNNELPPLALAITFDDGYYNNYSVALPVLKKYHIPATVFVASQYVEGGMMWNDIVSESIRLTQTSELDLSDIELGIWRIPDGVERVDLIVNLKEKIKYLPPPQRDRAVELIQQRCQLKVVEGKMMNREQLAELDQYRVEVGAHTVTHPILSSLDEVQAEREIKNSKQQLQKLLKREVRFFAYPNGKPGKDYTKRHVQMVASAGYQAAFSSAQGAADRYCNCFEIPRISPWGENRAQFILHLLRSL